jgi:serine/threonine protein kinase
MNNNIIECIFEINNSTLIIKPNNDNISYGYKIDKYINDGTIGKVYLLEFLNKKEYIIKISKPSSKEDLIDEINIFKFNLVRNNINNKIFPIFYGNFQNSDNFGIVYPYLGKHNFDTYKLYYKNNLSFVNNIDIIKQIIEQLISFDNIIHCDLKLSNIVVDMKNNKIITSIIDLGLSNLVIPTKTVLSTNYITSPESLLTMDNFSNCVVNKSDINIKKHDYFGLFCFIINIFLDKNYWDILDNYLTTQLKFNIEFILSQHASLIYVYIWYKFNNSTTKNISLKNVILKIEKMYPQILEMKFINFETFFKLYILPNLNFNTIKKDKVILLYDFLSLLIKFDPDDRPEFKILLNNSFLQ